jgi:hypothetical protein
MNLKESIQNHNQVFIRSVRMSDSFCPCEADDDLNESAIQVIEAMKQEHGEAWIIAPNTGKYFKAADDNIYIFCGCYVVPKYDDGLNQLVQDRLEADYTGTKDDSERVARIQLAVEEIGGASICWS